VAQSPEGWYEEPDELPPRRRTRLLTPLSVALLLVLFAACGFIGGVLVQKGQQSGTATVAGSSFASRFGGATGRGATGVSGAGALGGGGGFAGRLATLFGAGAAGSGETVGTVTDISGNKLYVTSAAGTMTEVITTPESKITKSESVGANAIHPGDSIVASGVTGPSGALTASTVSDSGNAGTSGSSGSGISSLFGGGASSTGATTSSGSSGLFGGG
jgi:hypothetical protein